MSDNLFRFPPQIHSIHRTASRSWPFILQQPILASAVWRQSTEKRLFLSSYMKKKHYTRDNCVFWGNIRCPAALGILLIIPNLPDKKPEDLRNQAARFADTSSSIVRGSTSGVVTFEKIGSEFSNPPPAAKINDNVCDLCTTCVKG